jgi:4a-hydroxytetrahydrobiopterin dehydratase
LPQKIPGDATAKLCDLFDMSRLSAAQIRTALRSVPEWKRRGRIIRRTYQFKDFPAAIRFVNGVARLAENAWHHPDIDVRWNKVTLTLTTHDAGGLTDKDFKLAERFDRV